MYGAPFSADNKIGNRKTMNKSLQIQELAVVITAKNINSTVLNLDFSNILELFRQIESWQSSLYIAMV